jgi:glucose-1-phosphate cytidylyltransferase
MSNDFVLSNGGQQIDLINSDIQDWRITFVDTGQEANLGQRLLRVREHLKDEELFMANYSDGLTDLPLDTYLDFARKQNKIGCFLAVRPTATFHAVEVAEDASVTNISPISQYSRINCGYFVFKPDIFDYIKPGEDLVVEPFRRLIESHELVAYNYDGFWECMDTFKDKQQFDDMYARGHTPWVIWKRH